MPFDLTFLFYTKSSYWGDIPSDLTTVDLIELALTLALTVFLICLAAAVTGQLIHAVRGFYRPRSRAFKTCIFGPSFVLLCGLGIWYFNQIEPLQGAIVLAVIPTYCMHGPILKVINDFVPEIGEIVSRLDPKVDQPLDMQWRTGVTS